MANRPAQVVLVLAALLGGGFLLWFLATPPLPQAGAPDPPGPEEPTDPEPPVPLGDAVHRLLVRVEFMAGIPDPAPPPLLYAGAEVGLRGSLEAVTVEGQPWPGPLALEVLAGPAAGRTLTVGAGARLTGLPEGLSLAEVRLPGWPSFRRLLRLRKEGTFPLIGPSAAPCPARGRVFGPDGRPLEGAEVEVDGRRARSDANGDFALDEVVPGEALFALRAPGCAPALHPCMVGLGYPPRPPLFILKRAVAVTGQVLYPDRPGEGVDVYLLPAGQGPGGPRFPFALLGSFRTGPDGNFSFPALPEGERFQLWARGEDLLAEACAEIGPLEAGARPRPVLVKLRRLGRLHGIVRSAAGPIPGALLRTGPAPAWRPGQVRLPGHALADLDGALVAGPVFHPLHTETRADAHGRFSLALAPPPGAPAVLDCLAEGYLPQRLERPRIGNEVVIELQPAQAAGEGPPGLFLARPPGVAGEIRLGLRFDDQAALPEEAWGEAGDFAIGLGNPGLYRLTLRWRGAAGWRTHEELLVVLGGRRVAWPF